MRSILALGLLITSYAAAADAATVHRCKPLGIHLRRRQRVSVRSGQRVTAPTRFPVGPTNRPNTGWTTPAPALAWVDSPIRPESSIWPPVHLIRLTREAGAHYRD